VDDLAGDAVHLPQVDHPVAELVVDEVAAEGVGALDLRLADVVAEGAAVLDAVVDAL
jgi:hypothetical protein